MPISYDAGLFRKRMAVIESIQWAEKVVAVAKAYAKCVRESDLFQPNPDCQRILMAGGPFGASVAPDKPTLIEELLAQMPEDAQEHVGGLLLEAQARLLEKYHAKLDEVAREI